MEVERADRDRVKELKVPEVKGHSLRRGQWRRQCSRGHRGPHPTPQRGASS